jgi:hypothetical protein
MINIKKISGGFVLFMWMITIISCQDSSHQQMINILARLNKRNNSPLNPFSPEAKVVQCDSFLTKIPGNSNNASVLTAKAGLLLKVGREEEAVKIYEGLIKRTDFMSIDAMMPDIGLAYMRLGERSNCMLNHNGESCIFPIKDGGIHLIKTGSTKAIETYESVLKSHPEDLSSRWLLNIAFMTLGGYPKNVPKE